MIAIQSSQPERSAAGLQPRPAEDLDAVVPRGILENQAIADLLAEAATLLAHQGASEFRVQAYRSAAQTLSQLDQPVRDILGQRGIEGLIAIPTVGRSIAHLIQQYLRAGHVPLLDRLRGEETALRLFATLPSVGPELARRIHDQLGIETLPELMAAVHDGRLGRVPGVGRKRVRAIGECLTLRLRNAEGSYDASGQDETSRDVPVSEILDVDSEYRRLAAQGKLPKIAPRRFNPDAIAWLPILHTQRGDRHYTALFSNTARAHQLNTIRDWVVIFRDDPQAHGRWTVITSQFGKLRGWRIIRGREEECSEYYIHNH
jgi:hypothetical protein